MWKKTKNMGRIHVTAWMIHIAVLWFRTSCRLVQTFWRHILKIVAECVCWTLKHNTTKTHVAITLKSAI
jgi:hypothetical protein